VDDEPDILSTVREELDECVVETAPDFNSASALIEQKMYDAAIVDIMGVQGYNLLEISTRKAIPTIMLTAHALSPGNLVKSVKKGATAYVPKEKISEIKVFFSDILEAHKNQKKGWGGGSPGWNLF
jgi:DNA-binding response OmpR family regulator